MKGEPLCDVEHRVVSLRGRLDADAADLLVDRLLRLDTERRGPITLYVAAQGGTMAEALKIADILAALHSKVTSVGLGLVEGAAAWPLLLAGRRQMLPGSMISTQGLWQAPQPEGRALIGLGGGNLQATLVEAMTGRLLALAGGRIPRAEELLEAAPRLYSAEEAVAIHLVDAVLPSRRKEPHAA